MNDTGERGLPDFDRPTAAWLGQLCSTATQHGRIPLRVIDFRTPGQGDGIAEDGQLTLDLNGTTQQYTVVTRGRVRSRAEIDAIAARSGTAVSPILLVTTHLTLALADACVEHDLQFIDMAGNLHVHAPGQYILVTGRSATHEIRRLSARSGKPAHSASTSALRMIFVLLSEPALLNRSYRDIAAAAGIALGTVGSVLDDLRERGLLAGAEDRRLLDPGALRAEWAINYPLRLLPKLNVQRFAVDDPMWWEQAVLPAGHAWWSGEVAAARLTGQLRPGSQTIYVDPAARPAMTMELAKRFRLRTDPAGTLEIVDAFWRLEGTPADEATAPPLLVYADLQRTREPRNTEAALLIREQMEQGV